MASDNPLVPRAHGDSEDVAEINGPDPVVGLLKTYRMLLQRIGEKEQPRLESDGPRVRHAFDEEMAGVLDRWQRARVAPRGGPVQPGGRSIT